MISVELKDSEEVYILKICIVYVDEATISAVVEAGELPGVDVNLGLMTKGAVCKAQAQIAPALPLQRLRQPRQSWGVQPRPIRARFERSTRSLVHGRLIVCI